MKPSGFWIATFFGAGLLRGKLHIGAGTWGSLFALPLCWMLILSKDACVYGDPALKSDVVIGASVLLLWFGLLAYGVTSIPVAEKLLGERKNWKGKMVKHDQNEIVIDEVFGMMVAITPMFFMEYKHIWLCLLLSFIFFRFFDVVKVWPTKLFDRWQSPWGVMLDDGIAGIYAAICVCFCSWLFQM